MTEPGTNGPGSDEPPQGAEGDSAPMPRMPGLPNLRLDVPVIVLIAAALPMIIAGVFALIAATITSLLLEGDGGGLEAFATTLGLLAGHEVAYSGSAEVFMVRGSGSFAIRFAPLGSVVLSAWLLTRIGFTRAWLSLPQMRWLPAGAGVLISLIAFFVAAIAGSSGGLDLGFVALSMDVRPSLTGLLLVGAGPWLLARLMVRWVVARNLVWGLVGLQLLFTVVLLGSVIDNGVRVENVGFGELMAQLVGAALFGVAYAPNLIGALLWWPFLGLLGFGGNVATLVSFAGERTAFTFFEAASEEPLLWLAPIIAGVGLLATLWFQPVPRSQVEVGRRVGRDVTAFAAVLFTLLWAGRMRSEVTGDFASELAYDFGGNEMFDFGEGMGAALDVYAGAVGIPIRVVPLLALVALLGWLLALYAAQSSGVSWASPDAVTADARRVGGSLVSRARSAAQAAQTAAASSAAAATAAATPPTTNSPAGHLTPAEPTAAAEPRASADVGPVVTGPPVQPRSARPAPSDVPVPGIPGSEGGPSAAAEPTPTADDASPPRWTAAPPPDPGTRRDS